MNKSFKAMSTYEGENLIFIVGCPRSGTTWLQKLLASHPKIKTGQESGLFDSFIGPQLRAWKRDLKPETSGRGAIGLSCYLEETEFLELLHDYMLKLLRPMINDLNHGEYFLEKTPGHGLYIPEIITLLPKCKIIHIVRDPRSVVSSLIAASKSWGSYWAPANAYQATKMWTRYVSTIKVHSECLSSQQFYEVFYEDLHNNTLDCIAKISEFLEITWTSVEMTQGVKNNSFDRIQKTGGTDLIVTGEAAKSNGKFIKEPEHFFRKGNPNSWRQDLTLVDKIVVNLMSKKLAHKLGYF